MKISILLILPLGNGTWKKSFEKKISVHLCLFTGTAQEQEKCSGPSGSHLKKRKLLLNAGQLCNKEVGYIDPATMHCTVEGDSETGHW